jgi:hypothetical protein
VKKKKASGFCTSYTPSLIVMLCIVLGRNLFKGLGMGTGTVLTMMLQETAAAAEQGQILTSR